jgi:curved DNA-binding protein CbpA
MDATSQPPLTQPVQAVPASQTRWTQAMLRQLVSIPPGALVASGLSRPAAQPPTEATLASATPTAMPVFDEVPTMAPQAPASDSRELQAPANIEPLQLDLARAPRDLMKGWLEASRMERQPASDVDPLTFVLENAQQTPVPPNPFLTPPRYPTPSGLTAANASGDPVVEQELLARVSKARTSDHFARLGVEKTATSTQIREAFLKLTRKYHPARLASSGQAHLTAPAQELFALLRESHDILVDAVRRQRHLADLTGGAPARLTADEAKAAYQRGLVHLRRLNLRHAETELTRAVEADPRPDYLAELAWTLHSQGDPRVASRKRVADLLSQALRDPRECNDRVYFLAAQISKATGDAETAKRLLRHALARNATNVEARRELRALERVG